jgi:hypothetical protein
MIKVMYITVGLLSIATVAHAEFFVCGDAVRSQCANTVGLTRVITSIDPTHVNDPSCFMVPENQLDTQKFVIQSVINSEVGGRKVGVCHLKVVNGLAVEMTADEKTTVNNAIQAVIDAQGALEAEANDALCINATLQQIDTFFDNLANNPNNTDDIAGDIAALTTNTAAAIRQMETATNTRIVQVLRKMAKCIRASRR